MTSDGTQITRDSTLAFVGVGEEGAFQCIDVNFISGSKW